jgi:hypothetical protein
MMGTVTLGGAAERDRCWSASLKETNRTLKRAWVHCAVGIELNPEAITQVVRKEIKDDDADERSYAFLSIAASKGSVEAEKLLAEKPDDIDADAVKALAAQFIAFRQRFESAPPPVTTSDKASCLGIERTVGVIWSQLGTPLAKRTPTRERRALFSVRSNRGTMQIVRKGSGGKAKSVHADVTFTVPVDELATLLSRCRSFGRMAIELGDTSHASAPKPNSVAGMLWLSGRRPTMIDITEGRLDEAPWKRTDRETTLRLETFTSYGWNIPEP